VLIRRTGSVAKASAMSSNSSPSAAHSSVATAPTWGG
jgi:hypothetical protein